MAPIVADALEVTGSTAGRGFGASAMATSLAVHAGGVALLLLLVSAPSVPPQPLPIQVVPVVVLQGGEIEAAETRAARGGMTGGGFGEPVDAPTPAPMLAQQVEPPVPEAVTASVEAAPPVPVDVAPPVPVEHAPPVAVEAAPPVPVEAAPQVPVDALSPEPVEAEPDASPDPQAVAVSWTPAKPPRKAPKRPPAPAAVDLEATLAKLKPAAPPQPPKPAATAQALQLAAAPNPPRALPVSLQRGGASAVGGGRGSGATDVEGDSGLASSPTQARFSGQGLSNPAPRYPMTARRRGQEGRVLLRVLVTTEGLPGAVSLLRSSGHRLLDKAAMAAVEDWRFVPARLRGAAVVSEIDVPIAFKLTD